MVNIAIVVGSTRPGRNAAAVAQWVKEQSAKRSDARFDILDIADFDLPVLDEPVPASFGQYSKPHTKAWAEAVAKYDGYVFVTPEYNHSTSGALKNALDYIYQEWNNKAVGFVSYGSAGGVRAVEHLRGIAAELQMADVRAQVTFSLFTDFVNFSEFRPDPRHEQNAETLFSQLISWSAALKAMREGKI